MEADSHLLTNPVPDEGGLPGGVLAHQQHHGLGLEVRALQGRGVEVMEEVGVLQRQQLLGVERVEALGHRLVHLPLLVAAALLLFDPAEHAAAAPTPTSLFGRFLPSPPAAPRCLLLPQRLL